jgi:membrane protein
MVETSDASGVVGTKRRSVRRARPTWGQVVGIVVAVFQGAGLDQLTLRSMSLSFASLLSMVPLLAFSFSVLKGFGVHNFLEPMLAEFLAPLGEGGAEIANNIIAFVENINVGVLGFAGLLVLIFTVISLVQKIENAFNYIWYVRKSRTLVERLRDYLSIILIGPLIGVSVIGLFTSVEQAGWLQYFDGVPLIGSLLVFVLQKAPLLLIFAAFTFFYAFVPNTRVDWSAAFGGALVSGVLWLVAGWAFTSFAASSVKYTAIYSGFAVVILFLIWLNLNWLFILIGSAIAFYLQYPAYLRIARGSDLTPSPAVMERAVLQILVLIVRDYRQGKVCWDSAGLAKAQRLPHTVVNRITANLMHDGLLVKTEGNSGCFLPGKASECMQLTEILQAAHYAGKNFTRLSIESGVLNVFEQLDAASAQLLEGRSLADLVDLVGPVDDGPGR